MRMLNPLAAVVALLWMVAGCDSGFLVGTPWQPITIDASALGLTGSSFPSIPCTSDATCGAGKIPCGSGSFSCKFSCQSKKCAVTMTMEAGSTVDLRAVIKDKTSATALSKVTLDRMVFNTEGNNTLTMDTPVLDMYLGGTSAQKTTDEGVVKFATVPKIPKNTIKHDYVNVTRAGQAELEKRVLDFERPFKMFGKATLTFKSGDKLPSGRLKLKLKAYFLIDPM